MNTKIIATITTVLGVSFAALAADEAKLPPASTKTGVTYATDIKPILDKSCAKCHSGDKPKAKLKLDALEGVLKGSKEGNVVLPGKSADSQLVKAAGHVGDPDDWMPPAKAKDKFPPLTPEQVGLIRAWIDQGAK